MFNNVLTQRVRLMFVGRIPINQISIEVNLHLLRNEHCAVDSLPSWVSRNFGEKRPTGDDFLYVARDLFAVLVNGLPSKLTALK